jgi:hypothetical protein
MVWHFPVAVVRLRQSTYQDHDQYFQFKAKVRGILVVITSIGDPYKMLLKI